MYTLEIDQTFRAQGASDPIYRRRSDSANARFDELVKIIAAVVLTRRFEKLKNRVSDSLRYAFQILILLLAFLAGYHCVNDTPSPPPLGHDASHASTSAIAYTTLPPVFPIAPLIFVHFGPPPKSRIRRNCLMPIPKRSDTCFSLMYCSIPFPSCLFLPNFDVCRARLFVD